MNLGDGSLEIPLGCQKLHLSSCPLLTNRYFVTMMSKGLAALSALAGVALAQSTQDLATVLNGTDGASNIAQAVVEAPGFLDAIAGKSNLTFLAPNDTAIALFLNSSQGAAAEAMGEEYLTNLLLYHTINGGYSNITDYFVAHSLLTSNTLTNISDG